MKSYLDQIASSIASRFGSNPESCIIIVPSAQSGTLIQTKMAREIGKAIWSPKVFTIQQWCEFLCGEKITPQTDLLPLLFEAYGTCMNDSTPFHEFKGWGDSLLRDFQEIQLSEVDAESLFTDLREMKDIDEWSFRLGELTPGQVEYLDIWKKMGEVYNSFLDIQQEREMSGYAMMVTRLLQNRGAWISKIESRHCIFAGHRTLSRAEHKLIDLVPSKELWLDRDLLYEQTTFHEAGSFIKRSGRGFTYIDEPSHNWLNVPRQIRLHACSTPASECIKAGQILSNLPTSELAETALVVMDDKWIPVVLDHIPRSSGIPIVAHGYSLLHSDIASLISTLTELSSQLSRGIIPAYQELLEIIRHDSLSCIFQNKEKEIEEFLIDHQTIRLYADDVDSLASKFNEFGLLVPFFSSSQSGISLGNHLLELLEKLDEYENRNFQRELINLAAEAIDESVSWISRFTVADDPNSFGWIFGRLAAQKKIPLLHTDQPGPSIFHLSETIHLDYNRVIILGANEGLLPSTRAASTIIPFEIRRLFGLPLAEEEEQLQAWLFYRLLQRARQVDISYSKAGGTIGQKEMSRYLIQLIYETQHLCPNTSVEQPQNASRNASLLEDQVFRADDQTRKALDAMLERGISASAINTWNQCPLDFYFKNLLRLYEPPEMEESMKPSTLGTITHGILEELYKPFINGFPKNSDYGDMLAQVSPLTSRFLDKYYSSAASGTGRNYIASRVIEQMITNYIRYEKQLYEKVEPSQRPVIIALEKSLQTTIQIEGRDKPIVLKGVIDRLEKTAKGFRVIDFKTGKVSPSDVKCKADGSIMKESKLLQLSVYMLLVRKELALKDEPVSAGIFSFISSSKDLFMAQPYQDDIFPKPETFDRITAEIQDVVLKMLNSDQYTHTESNKSYCTYCTI